jgi:MerR family transcriptional regulator, light-induced transcriptional regulator
MNLQEAANHIGVHYQTAYRWVRTGELQARKNGRGYEVDLEDVTRFAEQRATPLAPPPTVRVRSWESQRTRLLTALLDGDELAARQITRRLFDGGVAGSKICDLLIGPTLVEVGAMWHRGETTVVLEHRATEICQRLLSMLHTHHRGRPRGTALVVCAPGDAHSMPAMMAAIALREDRWRVHHLGVNVPVEGIAELAKQEFANLVVVSATYADSKKVREFCKFLKDENIDFLVGGISGSTLHDLVSLARNFANAGDRSTN